MRAEANLRFKENCDRKDAMLSIFQNLVDVLKEKR